MTNSGVSTKRFVLIACILGLTWLLFSSPGCSQSDTTVITHIPVHDPAQEGTVNAPPELLISCEGETMYALRGTTSWVGLESDSHHPLHLRSQEYMPELQTNESDLTFDFGENPDQISVRYWSDEFVGDEDSYESNFTEVETNSNTMSLPREQGKYIYEVYAAWDSKDPEDLSGSGAAYYMFSVQIR